MARTRQLHPEFFKHEDLGELSPLHRLLFQGLWCIADRMGRLEDRPRKLKAEILPYDTGDGEELIADLALRGFVKRYTDASGKRLLWLPTFKTWQRVHPKEVASEYARHPDDTHPEESPGTEPGRTQVNPRVHPTQNKGDTFQPLSSLPSLPSQSSLPSSSSSTVAAAPTGPVLTGKDLQTRWNASRVDGTARPTWSAMPPGQEMQADAVALRHPIETWDRFFAVLRTSALLNGQVGRRIPLTPLKLLREPDRWVAGALNGDWTTSGKDLPPEHAPPEPEITVVWCSACGNGRAMNPLAARPLCAACVVSDIRAGAGAS